MVSKKRSNESQESTGTPDARGDSNEKSRRRFLEGGIGLVAGVAATQLLPHPAAAAPQDAGNAGLIERLRNPNGRPILLKDGIILSMDPQVGDFEKGDVLLQGKKIVSVGPNVEMPKSAVVVNAAGMIVMPGMIDTHHHQYEAILRSILADGVIPVGVPGPRNNYTSVIQGTFTPVYLPEDAHIAELLASLSQINDGVTTAVDTSQVQLTPDHTDACIAGLKESGRRALFAYGAGGEDAARKFPVELARLRKQYFSSPDQLLTL